jgi:hypothetical protein
MNTNLTHIKNSLSANWGEKFSTTMLLYFYNAPKNNYYL